jgi:NAD(P)-dependent dehydrogenase (short-subunit alcohol dehydrogenase family)
MVYPDLKNKVVMVTGGGRGIGRAFCLGFSANGSRVVVADTDLMNASNTVNEIKRSGGHAIAMQVDVTNFDEVQNMATRTLEIFGSVDVLVNNAALVGDLELKPWDQISPEEWDRVLRVNVTGMFYCARAVVPHMIKKGKGKIINIASDLFLKGGKGRLHYITSKAAVVGFTRALARELGDYNINVNAVAPGLTYTGYLKVPKEWFDVVREQRCLKRNEYPEDLVGTVLFLASEASDFITGQTIVVNGGDVLY